MKITEIKDNLFGYIKPNDILLHCISNDFALGAGFASILEAKYPTKRLLFAMQPGENFVNKSIIIKYALDDSNYFYIGHLVTKEKYYHKPTYESFTNSLNHIKYLLDKHYDINENKNRIIMPRIGSGLDKLDWNKNLEIIKDIFKDTNYQIDIYYI